MPTYDARKAGIYKGFIYKGCTEKTITDRETGEENVAWLWRFQDPDDSTTVGEIAKFTGTSMQSPNSNAYKIAAGIIGRKLQPGDDTEAHVGELYDVVYGPNQAGNLTITSVVPSTAPKPVAVPSPAPQVEEPSAVPAALPEMP